MPIIMGAIVLSVLGAVALQRSSYEVDHSGAYGIAGYITFIISFALLEYGWISMSIAFVFGIWATGNAILTILIGRIFYEEELPTAKAISLIMVLVGLIGLSLN